jgi:phosphate transport system substrate-binding protein
MERLHRAKLTRQLLSLGALAGLFILLNLTIFFTFTRRCIPTTSEGMQAKSVELGDYLPFTEDSKIARLEASLKLTKDLPVIDGAAALYPVFSGFVNAVYPADSVHFDGEGFTADSALRYSNTRGAYRGIVDGTVDIAICVAPSQEQLDYAAERGVELVFTPIGRDAFVFLVNRDNPVDGLTVEQVKGIYAGEYTRWSQVGGDRTPIAPLQRNAGSGSQSALLNFMGDTPVKTSPFTFLGRSIGFSFRFYVEDIAENASSGGVKMLALDGVYPSVENIRSGAYPIVTDFYAVTRKGETNPNVERFVAWMTSEEGRAIVEGSGYVGVE